MVLMAQYYMFRSYGGDWLVYAYACVCVCVSATVSVSGSAYVSMWAGMRVTVLRLSVKGEVKD